MKNKLFILLLALLLLSGCGKNTVYDELKKRIPDVQQTVSATISVLVSSLAREAAVILVNI